MTDKKEVKYVLAADKLLKTDKAITDAIVLAEKNAATVQKQYQRIAASVLVHLAEHKDIRLVRRMLDKLPEGLRANAMKAYLERFGQVRFLVEGDLLKPAYKGMEEGAAVFDATKKLKLAEALETPWWKAAKEPEYKPLDIDVMLGNIIRLCEARKKKGVSAEKGDSIPEEKLNAIKALVAKKA